MWAGTDACDPVTWQECKLVTKDVQFIVPDIKCSDHQQIWYYEPEPTTGTRMTNTLKCEVKTTTNCQSHTRQRLQADYLEWVQVGKVNKPKHPNYYDNNLREVPTNNCSYKKIHVPTQDFLHRKKCLFPNLDKLPGNKQISKWVIVIILNYRW